MKKNKDRVQRSEYDPVPLYRAYGVTKKETFLTHFNNHLADAIRIAILIWLLILWAIGITSLILMLEEVGVVLSVLSVLIFLYAKVLRKLRKRLRFVRKLKKKCKKLGYRSFSCRSLFSGLRLRREGVDLVLDTGKTLWLLRYLTPPQRLTKIILGHDGTVTIRTNIASEIASKRRMLSFGLPKNRICEYAPFDVSEGALRELMRKDPERKKKLPTVRNLPDGTNRTVACAVVINPSPYEMYKKEKDGAVIPIGTGEKLYGYTVFTGSGFLETMVREGFSFDDAGKTATSRGVPLH